jgi:hypothetical protein
MKTGTQIVASTSMVLLVWGASSAIAGPCTTEIDGLTKMISAKDAGSGPTVGAVGQAQAPASSRVEHPPTAVMNQETQGKATSPEDVRRQTQGQPTLAQQGSTGVATGVHKFDELRQALDRARALDAQGKETECVETVRHIARLVAGQITIDVSSEAMEIEGRTIWFALSFVSLPNRKWLCEGSRIG